MPKNKSSKSKAHGAAKPREGESPRQRRSRPEEASPSESIRRRIPSQAAIRETIESVVVAFVLAFLFRTFEAEAFVIPTGSMAPTLMGRHKDLVCPQCGYAFQATASEEVDGNGNPKGLDNSVNRCTCPMCRYTLRLDFHSPDPQDSYPSYKGDRILVGKFCYQFSDPDRWDVAVFKYPGGAKTNYIKRLVGLPNENVKIHHGDIFTAPATDANAPPQWMIARKPPEKLLAMLQPVFDNEVMPRIVEQGWPVRWAQYPEGAWEMEGYRTFQTAGVAGGEAWVQYEHRVPNSRQWRAMADGVLQPADMPPPQLISDFCAYNTSAHYSSYGPTGAPDRAGVHWVGDLAVECTLEVTSESGEALFELVEGGRRFQCRIDVATGMASLRILDPEVSDFRPTARTEVRGRSVHEIRFSNCDDQLLLWVDGSPVAFDAPSGYPRLGNVQPRQADLAPVRIGSAGGAGLRVSRLKIFRDIYYIAERTGQTSDGGHGMTDFKAPLHDTLTDPSIWPRAFDPRNIEEASFLLEADQFLALGDNSARSKDGRLWEKEGFDPFVSRDLLIGKALYIYWPHSWDRLPGTSIPFPLFPNFPRMGLVR